MTEKSITKPPIWFWIVSVIALLWNGSGVYMYLIQAYDTESFRAMYPDPEMLEMASNTPAWVTAPTSVPSSPPATKRPARATSRASSVVAK